MVPYRSFNIYGTWEGKKGFKVIIWKDKSQRGEIFCGGSSPLKTPCRLYKRVRGRLPIQFTAWKLSSSMPRITKMFHY